MSRPMNNPRRGFTLIELLVVAAIAVIILVLAAPSFKQIIEMQRLKSVGSQVVTDLQFARSESVSRQRRVYVSFIADGASPAGAVMSCYVVHTCPTAEVCQCNCTAAAGSRCAAPVAPATDPQELRTHQIERSLSLRQDVYSSNDTDRVGVVEFEPVTGSMLLYKSNPLGLGPPQTQAAWIETTLLHPAPVPNLRTEVAITGRPNACAVGGRVPGVTACPP